MAGKGKVSNDLVAVGCAAVLAVYAAGYLRTRDAARRMEVQAQERREAVPERPVEVASQPAAIALAPADAQPVEVHAEVAPAPVAAELPQEPPITPPASPPLDAAASSEVAAAPDPPSPPLPAPVNSPQATPTHAAEPAIALAGWKDGKYSGWGTSRHGDILAEVVISNGRIVESSIVSCETRWPCDVISGIIDQPVTRQSAEVDRVSRATASADAYYFALVQALERAVPEPSSETATPP